MMSTFTPNSVKPASKEVDKLSAIPIYTSMCQRCPCNLFLGEFHPKSSTGNAYALTVICMLTGYTFCVPIKTKTTSEVVQAYIDNAHSKFGGSSCISSDNGTEFKNNYSAMLQNN